jgi:hypothetical protein
MNRHIDEDYIIAHASAPLKLVLGEGTLLAENNTIWLSMMDKSKTTGCLKASRALMRIQRP